MIKAMVVDNDFSARQRLKSFLMGLEDVRLVAEADNAGTALEAIQVATPDVIFLQIEIPGESVFNVLEQAVDPDRTSVVLISDSAKYAARAFETGAVDYLMRPFSEDRFMNALKKTRHFLAGRTTAATPRNGNGTDHLELANIDGRNRIVARSDGNVHFLKAASITWIGSEGNYVRLNLQGGRSYLIRQTMHEVERKLDPRLFLRIHRCAIVNLEAVRELKSCGDGEYLIVLHDGKELSLGQTYRGRVDDLLAYAL